MSLGLYIHVPFCGKKCRYCDFYSVCWTKQQAELYVKAVLRNLRHYSQKERLTDTVYFGGGTPSLLSPKQIQRIMNEAAASFALDKNAEVTLEANPGTLTPEKLFQLREAGINRLSIGVQSMNDDELKLLGRTHNAERAVKAVKDAADAGFDNISCDLMIALPGQKKADMERSIELMTALPIKHISAYMLKLEEGTDFFSDSKIKDEMPDDDQTAELYLRMVEMLEEKGFMQYEISNFAKAGSESRHNSRYWLCKDYIGIGPSAHSCASGKRFAVSRDIENFISSPVQNVCITDDNPCGFEESAMLRLRLKQGLPLSETGSHLPSIQAKLPPLIQNGLINLTNDCISLTPKGFLLSNQIIEYLIF